MNGGNKPLKYALLYGEAGYLVFPCRPGAKMPATRHGLLDASAEVDEIQRMFDDPDFNIGLACGPQPNDRNLLAIDVDAHKDGMLSWADLVVDRGDLGAPFHDTPNGGMHVFFDAPSEFRNSRERLGQGIDTRASGGYVVVPPSSLFPVDGGQDRPYGATGATALLTNVPPAVPGWLLELLEPQVDLEELSEADALRGSGPRQDEWESPADWIRRVGDWATELGRFGWSHAHGSYWVRPGKSVRDGHSAVLHEGGPLVVFSTDVPPELEALGKVTSDGTGFAVSLFDFIAAYEFGGDLSACARELRRSMPTVGVGHGQGPAPTVDGLSGRPEVAASVLNLPDEFWEARDILAHIRQAAQVRRVAPEALLAHALCRSATLIPPSLKLPPLIGGVATLDYLACVAARSGTGKSAAQLAAKMLLPDPAAGLEPEDRPIMFDMPLGSGEGVVQAFMVPEMKPDEDGKPKRTNRQIVGKQALHLIVDEGVAFSEMAARKGAIVVSTLLSAWSGATLGQLNAAAETRRVIEGGRVRVTAVLHIQSENAHKLFSDDLTTLGFTSRCLFVPGLDPSAPDVKPDWPGPISFPIPATIKGGGNVFETMTYAQAIQDEVDEVHLAVLRGDINNVERGHSSLLRCKTAAILALWEGSKHVDEDSWALAGQIINLSTSYLNMLKNLHTEQERDASHRSATRRGEADAVADDARERRAIMDFSLKLITKVPKDGIGRNDLRKKAVSSKTKHRFKPALAQALTEGKLMEVEGRLFRA